MKRRANAEDIASGAIRETEAQLAILRILAPLDRGTRERILEAAAHLMAAESAVPGVLARFAGEGAGK